MARIAIDARKYFDFGIGTYIQNLILALAELRPQHVFSLLVSPEDFHRVHPPEGWQAEASPFGRYSVGELVLLGRIARRKGTDLFHEPHYTLPMGLEGRSVVTIHDLIHLKMPQFFSPARRLYAKTVISHAVRNAGAIITVSQRTRDDILNTFRVNENEVEVVQPGIRPIFRRLEDSEPVQRFLSAAELRRPYVLYVGNVKPHKNISTLLTAFARLRQQFSDLDLVFVGGSCKGNRALREQAHRLGITEAIRDLHHLSDDELVCAYNAAEVLVLPSLYEGFGFPALEAMACGTPTVVSNGGSLPEVVGNASVIVDPSEPESLAEALAGVLADSQKRKDLVAKGKRHAERFSWKATGIKTLSIYEKVLNRWHSD